MNNFTDIIAENINNEYEMCQLDNLFEISTVGKSTMDPTIWMTSDNIQFISIFIASIIGVCSMAYGVLSSCFNHGLTLHFVGIRRPQNFSKSQFKLMDKIDTESTMVTVKTSLKPTDTIADLKEVIKKTYSIQDTNDILISYSSHIISLYENSAELTLAECGITDNSLLTLCICHSPQIKQQGKYLGVHRDIYEKASTPEPTSDPVHSVNQLFDMFQDEEDEQYPEPEEKEEEPTPKGFLEPYMGYDVIMQMGGVMVYRMPTCGHEMNKESLYHYAFNTFQDNKNLKLQCPHRDRDGKCPAEWDLTAVLDVLRHEHSAENEEENDSRKDIEDIMKLELLITRNKVESGDHQIQKCPRCKTLYYKDSDASTMKLGDIKTAEHIEQQFKTQCVLCQPAVPQNVDIQRLKKKGFDEEMEMKRAREINAMFDMFQDEEDEEENEPEPEVNDDEAERAQGQAVNAMFNMFQDEDDNDSDEEEEEEKKVEEEKYDENGYLILKPNNSFCFCCGEEWINGHVCDNSFRRDLVEILQKAEPKKIGKVEGVPSIRCCPECTQLLYHIDCCKHMRCGRCKTSFCMVCLKPKKDGNWQCGSSSAVCPIAPRQDMDSLPDNIVITKQKFSLYDEIEVEQSNDTQQ